ncbi:hypothetical protein EJ06DRAFT_530546 [Trichodelitschia bisporula]|uniref:Uncharacterized protein n=1 Tax=Trichodelitschia bisporula TaxID=703511 RepID=A0A6G1HUZ9_9PEZI|nr:hypothetical protein EJ06DRAFT_530546 [Trichodelitschia bisporula]
MSPSNPVARKAVAPKRKPVKRPPPPPKSTLSEEFVVESDSDDSPSVGQPEIEELAIRSEKPVQKATTKPDAKATAKPPTKPAVTAKKSKPPPPPTSESSDNEEDEETGSATSDSESDEPPQKSEGKRVVDKRKQNGAEKPKSPEQPKQKVIDKKPKSPEITKSKAAAPPPTVSSSETETESDSESEAEAGADVDAMDVDTPAKNTKPTSEEESDSASEASSSEVEEAVPPKKATPPKAKQNGKKAATPSSSDEESDSDASSSDEDTTPQKNTAKVAQNGVSKKQASESEAESEVDEEESGDAESGSEEAEDEEPEAEEAPQQSTRLPDGTVHFRPAPPFHPPRGFQPIEASSIPTAPKFLSAEQLQGKQLWYITAPANVPITELKEVALEKISNNEPVFAHDGMDFAFVQDEEAATSTRIAVPRSKGFEILSMPVSEVLHMQQVPHIPSATDSAPGPRPPNRPQPKGLKMRFRPAAFGKEDPGTIGSSDDEQAPRPQFVKPRDVPVASESRKRKADDEAEAALSKKKKKKHSLDRADVPTSSPKVAATPDKGKKDKEKKRRRSSQV